VFPRRTAKTAIESLVCAGSRFEPSSDPRREAHHERTVGHVLCHHRVGAADGATADSNAGAIGPEHGRTVVAVAADRIVF
jgi:hypothetical protein